MPITQSNLSPQQKMLMGAYYAAKPLNNTAFADLFKGGVPIMSATKTLEIDVIKSKVQAADVVKKDGKGKPIENQEYFTRKTITPGDIYAEIELSTNELTQMQAGETEVFIIGGKAVQTGTQLAARKAQWLLTSMENAKNIMCTQAINDGIVYNTDKKDYLDYGISPAIPINYKTSDYLLAILSEHFVNYRRRTGKSQNKTLIGADIAIQMLKDTKVQDSMYKLGYTNAANNLSTNDMALIIGNFMGKLLEQMDISPDNHGVDIIPGNIIKLLDTNSLTMGYAAISVKTSSDAAADLWKGDVWVDIDTGKKSDPKSVMFARSGAFPIIIDSNTIYTLSATLA